jgi:hypothetical protein
LRHQPAQWENVLSLEWLEKDVAKIQGLGSLALARLCLKAYGRSWPNNAPVLGGFHKEKGFLTNIQVAAWCCLALGAKTPFLSVESTSEGRHESP